MKTGRIILDLPPMPGNPRNSEGSFLELKDGRLMFAFSRYIADRGDDAAPAGVAAMYSSDNGDTWTEPEMLLYPTTDEMNLMSVSLIRLNNGDIGLIYFRRRSAYDGRAFMRRSSDEGKTWSEGVNCTTGPGQYVTNNDRIVKLSTGRLINPAAHHRIIQKDKQEHPGFDWRSAAYFMYSDDDGESWNESLPSYINSKNNMAGLQEPGVVELKNGTLYGWARTDKGFQYEMYSHDQGESWSDPVPSRFSSPNSPMSLKRNPYTEELFAIWNPIPNYVTRVVYPEIHGRTPLVYSISTDEGRSWSKPVFVEDDPMSGYCYTAIHFNADGSMLLAYCAGSIDDGGCLHRLRIRKIDDLERPSEKDPHRYL